MPWNRTTRKEYNRDGRRYENDVTEQQGAIVEAMLPKQGRLGRPRETDLRGVFNASRCWPRVASGGRCRGTFHPVRRSSTTFAGGKVTVFSTA
jgi:hypothetical protein